MSHISEIVLAPPRRSKILAFNRNDGEIKRFQGRLGGNKDTPLFTPAFTNEACNEHTKNLN
jgi:hypothetical protein